MKTIEFECVSREAARLAFVGGPTKPGTWRNKRARSGDEPLLGATRAWLATLPEEVRPMELVRQFPRIPNRLRHLWKQVARFEAYLDDLLIDHRGNRKGFPQKIVRELEALRDYHESLHPRAVSVWDRAN